jgi:hypothetical protein
MSLRVCLRLVTIVTPSMERAVGASLLALFRRSPKLVRFAKSASQSITSSHPTSVAIDSIYPSQINTMRQIAFSHLTAVAIPH